MRSGGVLAAGALLVAQLVLPGAAVEYDYPEGIDPNTIPFNVRHLFEKNTKPEVPDHLKPYVNKGNAKPFTKDDYINAGGTTDVKRTKSQLVDLPYIGCQVCELVMESFHNATSTLYSTSGDGKLNKKVVRDIADRLCLIERKEGRWMSHMDIVEEPAEEGGRRLKMVPQKENGQCDVECITIVDSCEKLFKKEIEKDTLIIAGSSGRYTLQAMQDKFCTDFSRRCKGNKRDKVMKASEKRKDYPFKPKDAQGKKHDLLMDRLAEGGVLGDASGNSAPDVADRLFDVIRMMEENGEL